MAPKCLPAKRPAAAVASIITKPKQKAKLLSSKKCQTILSRLLATGELPASLQLLMTRLARGLAAKGKRHIGEEAGTSILGKAIRGVESTLERRRSEAQAVVDGADAEMETRALAQRDAELELCNLRQAVTDKKAALAEAAKAIEEQKAAVQAARVGQRRAEAEAKGSEGRKRQLEVVERESYEPLKDTPASGPSGQKRLLTLRKFGRHHGFHKELLSVLPAVLRKLPDKRRTFDGLCLQQLEVEFARQADSLNCTLRDAELLVAQQAQELEQALAALQEAKEQHRTGARELVEAESALEAGRTAVVEARRHLKRLPADMKAAMRRLTYAEARVEKFRRGPLAAYRKALPLPEVQVGGSPPAASEEPPREEHPTEEEFEEDEEQHVC